MGSSGHYGMWWSMSDESDEHPKRERMVVVTFRTNSEWLEMVEQHCKRHHLSRSKLIRRAVAHELEERGKRARSAS